jgi:hypothetical protein
MDNNKPKTWPTVSRPELDASSAVQTLFLDRVQKMADQFVIKANERGGPDSFDAVRFAYLIVKADRAMTAAFRAIERLERINDDE